MTNQLHELHEKFDEDEFIKELALFVGTARFNAGMSQKKLSELTGVKIHSIHSLENAMVKKPNLLLILKVAFILDIDIEGFMGLKKRVDLPLKERLSLEQVDKLKYKLWDIQKGYDRGAYGYNKFINEQEHYNLVKEKQKKYVSITRFVSQMRGTRYTLDDLIRYSFNKSIDTFYNR